MKTLRLWCFLQTGAGGVERAKQMREYGLDSAGHPNWFDASFVPWISYELLSVELSDGYRYFSPIVNWEKQSCAKRG